MVAPAPANARGSLPARHAIRVLGALSLVFLPLQGCSNHGREFHPEAILGIAAIGAVLVYAPEALNPDSPTEFDRQFDELERANRRRR